MVIKMETSISLQEQALKRKDKLQALKRKREGETNTEPNQKINDNQTLPRPKFRSYRPHDDKLTEHSLPEAGLINVEEEIKDQLESAKSNVVIDELDITNLAPRKPDWDLKRDVAKKLEKLERRTQKAIAELIRDRLKQRQDDLATMVNAGTISSDNR